MLKAKKVDIVRWYTIDKMFIVYSSRARYAALLKDGRCVELWVEDYRNAKFMEITSDGFVPLGADEIDLFCQIPEHFKPISS